MFLQHNFYHKVKIYFSLYLIFILTPIIANCQIAFHNNIYLNEDGTLGIHTNEAKFVSGSILSDDIRPGITYFSKGTEWDGANHTAHVEGYVWITEHSDFNFPVGHADIYQPMAVHNSPNSNIAGRFVHESPVDAAVEKDIGKITHEYFWEVISDDTAQLSFGWTSLSNLNALTDDLEDLLLVGYNGNRWEIIPAKINDNFFGDSNESTLESGAITSVNKVDLKRYNRFTLGARIKDTRIQISEVFTPNGDGINDTWHIRNIDLYPAANIRIYNRWGSLIHEATNGYENDWNGHFAEKRNPLPSAPYFYQIDLESDGEIDIEGWLYINY